MSTTLIIVILILVCVLTTPLSLKRLIDRKKVEESKGRTGPAQTAGSDGRWESWKMDGSEGRCEGGEMAGFDGRWESGRMGGSEGRREGGEMDPVRTAGHHPDIPFPIFTNGRPMDETCLDLFDRSRNLLPVISLEGEQNATDTRQGIGMYQHLPAQVEALAERGIPFGVSVTATTKNQREVTSESFAETLFERGCKMILYIGYVSKDETDKYLELAEADRAFMNLRLEHLRQNFEDMVILSFPGDEKSLGGSARDHNC